jgi:polysaccharide export outer membrane protein
MRYLFYLLIAVLAASCTINKNIMFKTDTDFEFDQPRDSAEAEYRISPNDILLFRLFTNDGAKLLEVTTAGSESQRFFNFGELTYRVEVDGFVKLPELGRVEIAGKTIREAEIMLEGMYTKYYNEPYAIMQPMNNRVIVFPGAGGEAIVITLENQNTTVIEALALAGGISDRGNASKVKLIRENGERREIYQMNMSTIEGIDYARMTVQANDILYVEPVPEIANEVLKDIAPLITIITSVALVYIMLQANF